MLSLDDFDNEVPIAQETIKTKYTGFFTGVSVTDPIVYNLTLKQFIPNNKVDENNAFVGWLLSYTDKTDMVDVLYRGFLLKEPLRFSLYLKPQFIQKYIYDNFTLATKTIIENMPRIKRLKRINLKMLTKEHAVTLYQHINDLIRQYEIIYDYNTAQMMKAQITTSPFYVNDNGIIKLYNFLTNELTIPDFDSEGYFLAYFSFVNKTR